MLTNIKSSFFIQKLFSYIEDINKLGIAKYNKAMQNMIKINLIDYRLFTGKNIIYDSKNYGKEYDIKGILLYEGEYLDGRRSGKGKEFNHIKLITFEG